MPSKLKFKGQKPKKRKREDESNLETAKSVKTEVEGWVTLTSLDQLQGPVMILNQTPACIRSDLEGKVYTSQELDLVNDEERLADRTEPTSVQQVFVVTPLDFGSDKIFAFKTPSGHYLSIKNGKFHTKSPAIGAQESFKISPEQDGWRLKVVGDYVRFSLDEKEEEYQVRGSSRPQPLILRIQAKYAIKKGPEIKLQDRVSTRELEDKVGRRLEDKEVRQLKRAFKDGKLNEALIEFRQKTTHDRHC